MLACTGVRAIAADEVRLGSSVLFDQFSEAVRSSKYLDQAGIKVGIIRFKTGEDVLDAVLKGSIDFGLIPLTALSKRKYDDQPQLYSVFTRPFLFTSSSEVIDIEGTPLGTAVLADVARTGIIPLSFWNRGISQIWARKPVNSADHFAGLSIARW
jgi:ABC-type amino acid transport substrate-binding protein